MKDWNISPIRLGYSLSPLVFNLIGDVSQYMKAAQKSKVSRMKKK